MDCRRQRKLSSAAIIGALTLVASIAGAAPKDTEALELAKKAIYTDYLATKFADAEKKLKQALSLCKGSDCSDKVKAQLHRDLGVVYLGGLNRADDGKAEFAEALRTDPAITLDADLASPEIEDAFKAVKGGAKVGAPAPTPTPAGPATKGDLVHTPPPEQVVLTPVPLYAELPRGVSAEKVQLSYKPFGSSNWKTVPMKQMGVGFGIEVPCAEIGSTTGNLEYFIQAFDETNAMVSWSGTRADPQRVPIRNEIQADPPHLPGQSPPAKCADKGDCPPEFPGCHDQKPPEKPPCDKDKEGADCAVEPPKDESRKNWVTAAFQQDFMFFSSNKATCAGDPSPDVINPYSCFDDKGKYYDGIPYSKSGDEVKGGMGVGTSRVMLGYDRAIGNFTLGARVGFAFGGGPQAPGGKAFIPVHGEARVAYYFGSDPFGRKGFRPYLVAGGGVAQVDGKLSVIIYKNATDFTNDTRTTLTAWRKGGLGFATIGAGTVFAITPRTGPLLEVKYMQLFGATMSTLNLHIGWAVGF